MHYRLNMVQVATQPTCSADERRWDESGSVKFAPVCLTSQSRTSGPTQPFGVYSTGLCLMEIMVLYIWLRALYSEAQPPP